LIISKCPGMSCPAPVVPEAAGIPDPATARARTAAMHGCHARRPHAHPASGYRTPGWQRYQPARIVPAAPHSGKFRHCPVSSSARPGRGQARVRGRSGGGGSRWPSPGTWGIIAG
jgi:hypothetical protein